MIQAKQSKKSFLYENSYYCDNLDIVKNEAIPNRWDCLAIYHGQEGSGKSTLMMQTAFRFDPDFSIEQVAFTPQQFQDAIENAKVGGCIVWDEAITGANAQRHAENTSKEIISKLTQIRKKRLVLLLGFPYLHMLNKYFVSRCLFSVYVYAKDFNDRGYFNFYDYKQTNSLYWYMKEVFSYYPASAIRVIKKTFAGEFSGVFPLNEDEYDVKKERARIMSGGANQRETRQNYVEKIKQEVPNIKTRQLARIFGVSERTILSDTQKNSEA